MHKKKNANLRTDTHTFVLNQKSRKVKKNAISRSKRRKKMRTEKKKKRHKTYATAAYYYNEPTATALSDRRARTSPREGTGNLRLMKRMKPNELVGGRERKK